MDAGLDEESKRLFRKKAGQSAAMRNGGRAAPINSPDLVPVERL